MRLRHAVALGLLAAVPSSADPPSPPGSEAMKRLADGSNAFGLDLYGRLRTSPGNLAFSPASLSLALAMTWGGARGETAARMKEVMRFGGSPGEVMEGWGRLAAALQDPARPLTLRIANRLFGEKSYRFESAFLDTTRAAFGASLEPLDFKAAPEPSRVHINGWVEGATEKRIRDLIPPQGIFGDTRLVLVNALYFLAEWRDTFEKDMTFSASFFASRTQKKDVPTMHRTGSFRFAQKDGVKMLEIPYKGDTMSMLVVLPDDVDGLGVLESSLTAERLGGLVQSLAPQRVSVSLPKFEINPAAALSLGDLLKAMGMAVAFDRQKADFTGIANPPDPADRLFIGGVFHKAFVKVDEKGTEAAAATAVVMLRAQGMPMRATEFKADHPFLFFLRDDASGLILFMGRVAEP